MNTCHPPPASTLCWPQPMLRETHCYFLNHDTRQIELPRKWSRVKFVFSCKIDCLGGGYSFLFGGGLLLLSQTVSIKFESWKAIIWFYFHSERNHINRELWKADKIAHVLTGLTSVWIWLKQVTPTTHLQARISNNINLISSAHFCCQCWQRVRETCPI